jgi:hypothetical protein
MYGIAYGRSAVAGALDGIGGSALQRSVSDAAYHPVDSFAGMHHLFICLCRITAPPPPQAHWRDKERECKLLDETIMPHEHGSGLTITASRCLMDTREVKVGVAACAGDACCAAVQAAAQAGGHAPA